MATTTNYSWTTPDDTDLVKDGAAAIRTLGSSADTTVKALNPGTTAGDIDYYTAATTKARVGIGTAGQVLTVNSGATAPEWQTLNAGGMTLISTTALTGASITLSSIPATYIHLQLVITNYLPATDNTPLKLRFNSDTNSRYKDGTSTTNNSQAFNATSIDLFAYQDSAASDGLMITDIYDYTNATTWKFTSTQVIWNNNTTPANSDMYRIFGMYNQTGAISSLTLFPNTGNFTSGSVKLYGVK